MYYPIFNTQNSPMRYILIFYFSNEDSDLRKGWIIAGQWQGRDLNERYTLIQILFTKL